MVPDARRRRLGREGPARSRCCASRPLDVAPVLPSPLWEHRTAVLTSATIPPRPGRHRRPRPPTQVDELDVGSPFDYAANALLYCAAHLPDPASRGLRGGRCTTSSRRSSRAAGGRTLALFTSWRAMHGRGRRAADAARHAGPGPGRPAQAGAWSQAFADDEATCLFATMGFWQGVDVPGRSLSLVTIDRLPFPRPDEPAPPGPPRAGPGRGASPPSTSRGPPPSWPRAPAASSAPPPTAASSPSSTPAWPTPRYRWDDRQRLPPMRRTRHRAEAEAFLQELTAD